MPCFALMTMATFASGPRRPSPSAILMGWRQRMLRDSPEDPPRKWHQVGRQVQGMARKATTGKAKNLKCEAHATKPVKDGHLPRLLRLVEHAPRTHDHPALFGSKRDSRIVIGANRIGSRPQLGRVGRSEREQVRHDDTAAVPSFPRIAGTV